MAVGLFSQRGAYSNLQKCTLQPARGTYFVKKHMLLLLILFACCIFLLLQTDLHYDRERIVTPPSAFIENISEQFTQGFLVNTKGCRIQDLDPFDQSIWHCLYDEKPIVCNKDKIDRLVKSTNNILYVDMSVLAEYNLTKDKVNCCYSPFWRQELSHQQIKENPKLADVSIRYANYCINFISARIMEQFVRVTCELHNGNIYKDYFTFVHLNITKTYTNRKKSKKINILMIGIDSVSRLNLHRQMPKTLSFLKTQNTVELLGYNKVGDNTFPNIVPVLTGMSVDELIQKCWQNVDTVFDECPFIWKNYKKHGYITGFGEDAATIGLFNYMMVGFRKQPTHFYLQPFNLAAESEIGHENWLNANLCLGKRLNLEVILDVIMQFVVDLKESSFFGFFWTTSLTHDYLNLPKYGDDYYLKLLKTLYIEGIFNTSMVILMSDHGMRWGAIRETYQGYLEERLPFVIISYPKWFAENFPIAVTNLNDNKRKLTTPFDLHETLMDLIDLKNVGNSILRNRMQSMDVNKGYSLFLPINDSRTCNASGIADNWCTCHNSLPISINQEAVKYSALSIITYLNKLLQSHRQCSRLYLNKIIGARVEKIPVNEEKGIADTSLIDYIVTIETVPGNAVFESFVRYTSWSRYFTVLPPISRINTYDNQSYCVTDDTLKLYCFCNSNY